VLPSIGLNRVPPVDSDRPYFFRACKWKKQCTGDLRLSTTNISPTGPSKIIMHCATIAGTSGSIGSESAPDDKSRQPDVPGRRPFPSIHRRICAIEFIQGHLGSKPLRGN